VSREKTGAADLRVAWPAQKAATAASTSTGIAMSTGVRRRVALARRESVTNLAVALRDDRLSRSKAKSRAD